MVSISTNSSMSRSTKENKLKNLSFCKIQRIKSCISFNTLFWEEIVEGYKTLDKYKCKFPETVADAVVELTTALKESGQKCAFQTDIKNYETTFYKINPILADLLSIQCTNIHWRLPFLEEWCSITGNVSNKILKNVFTKQIETVIVPIIQCLFNVGHYGTQLKVLSLLLKFSHSTNTTVQKDTFTEILPNIKLNKILDNFHTNNFEENARLFLNTFNMSVSEEIPVYSILAESGKIDDNMVIQKPLNSSKVEQPLWIDFNSSSRTISFFCGYGTYFPEKELNSNKTDWILVEIFVHNITLIQNRNMIKVATKQKLRIIPQSGSDRIKNNFLNTKNIYLKFSKTNFDLIQNTKVAKYMNSEDNINLKGFNVFHPFVTRKKYRKRRDRNQTLVKQQKEKISISNQSISSTTILDNDSFTNEKSSINVPETISKDSSKQHEKQAINVSKSPLEIANLNKIDLMDSRNENLKNKKTSCFREDVDKIAILDDSKKDSPVKPILKINNPTTDMKQNHKEKELIDIDGIYQCPTELKQTENDDIIQNSNRMVHLVHPLQESMNQVQFQNTIQEYVQNAGTIGTRNRLNLQLQQYTQKEQNTVRSNIKEIDERVNRVTKKFFKTERAERNVYDLEKMLRDAPKSSKMKKADTKKKPIVNNNTVIMMNTQILQHDNPPERNKIKPPEKDKFDIINEKMENIFNSNIKYKTSTPRNSITKIIESNHNNIIAHTVENKKIESVKEPITENTSMIKNIRKRKKPIYMCEENTIEKIDVAKKKKVVDNITDEDTDEDKENRTVKQQFKKNCPKTMKLRSATRVIGTPRNSTTTPHKDEHISISKIIFKPNERCDKSWLYDKFIVDLSQRDASIDQSQDISTPPKQKIRQIDDNQNTFKNFNILSNCENFTKSVSPHSPIIDALSSHGESICDEIAIINNFIENSNDETVINVNNIRALKRKFKDIDIECLEPREPIKCIENTLKDLEKEIINELQNSTSYHENLKLSKMLENLITIFENTYNVFVQSREKVEALEKKLKLEREIMVNNHADCSEKLKKVFAYIGEQNKYYEDINFKTAYETVFQKNFKKYQQKSIGIRQKLWHNYMICQLKNFMIQSDFINDEKF